MQLSGNDFKNKQYIVLNKLTTVGAKAPSRYDLIWICVCAYNWRSGRTMICKIMFWKIDGDSQSQHEILSKKPKFSVRLVEWDGWKLSCFIAFWQGPHFFGSSHACTGTQSIHTQNETKISKWLEFDYMGGNSFANFLLVFIIVCLLSVNRQKISERYPIENKQDACTK